MFGKKRLLRTFGYSERLAEAGTPPSVGSVGDSCANELADTQHEALRAGRRRDDRIGAALAAHFASRPQSAGLDCVPVSRRSALGDLRWLGSRQRWNELRVGCLFLRDRLLG